MYEKNWQKTKNTTTDTPLITSVQAPLQFFGERVEGGVKTLFQKINRMLLKHFQVNYQLKAPLSPQPPYPHCVEKGGETHFRAGFSPRSNFLGVGVGVG